MDSDAKTTLAFLFVDMEGSTHLLHALGDAYAALLAGYRRVLEAAIEAAGGATIDTQGDGHFAGFPTPHAAVVAAIQAQRELAAATWPADVEVRARMGVHVGEVLRAETGYVGLEVHRAARIASAGHGGQVLVSQPAGDAVADRLPSGVSLRDLGSHRFKDLSRPEQVFQLDIEGLPSTFPAIKSLEGRPHNLPVQLTTFVGRDAELQTIDGLWEGHRLVTLTGSGGSGKTRLALQVGAGELEGCPDGVWFVELAPVTDEGLVLNQVAAALGVRERPTTPLTEDVLRHLGGGEALVIFDNCEHLVTAAAATAEWLLREVPLLRILATSREVLYVPGEAAFRVPSLEVPAGDTVSPDAPAIRLFVDRAATVRPGLVLEGDELTAVAEICRRLEGIPLAIELAAARLKLLSARQIADRLDDQFRLLTAGSRTAPSRHRTLLAVMESSCELLTDAELAVFRRLSVFSGRFTMEAAEAVCVGEEADVGDFLDLFGRLVDTSLVIPDEAHELRFRMLGPLRQYGAQLLEEAGETLRARYSHGAFFREVVRGGGAGLAPGAQLEWIAGLAGDIDNLRAALGWALEAGEHDLAVGLAGGLARYWYRGGHFEEGSRWLGEVLAAGDHPPSEDLAAVLRFGAAIAADRGDIAEAERRADAETAVAAGLGDRVGMARSTNLRGVLAWNRGDLREAARRFDDGVALLPDRSHPFMARLLVNLALVRLRMGEAAAAQRVATELTGWTEASGGAGAVPELHRVLGALALVEGDPDRAKRHLHEGEAVYRQLGLTGPLGMVLQEMAGAELELGELDRAEEVAAEALALFREMGDHLDLAVMLSVAAQISLARGETAQARRLLDEGLQLSAAEERHEEIGECLQGHAELAAAAGEHERAVTLHAAAAALRDETGVALRPGRAAAVAAELESLAGVLGRAAYEAAWEAGQALTVAAACAMALGGGPDGLPPVAAGPGER